MVTGVITRDSIRNALMKGITAEQIIYYMQSHAHAQMRKKVGLRIVCHWLYRMLTRLHRYLCCPWRSLIKLDSGKWRETDWSLLLVSATIAMINEMSVLTQFYQPICTTNSMCKPILMQQKSTQRIWTYYCGQARRSALWLSQKRKYILHYSVQLTQPSVSSGHDNVKGFVKRRLQRN
jgi:hypothetical protein